MMHCQPRNLCSFPNNKNDHQHKIKFQKCLPNLEERVFICYIINKNCTIAAKQWDKNYASSHLSLSEVTHTSHQSKSTHSPFTKETTKQLLEWEHCQQTPHMSLKRQQKRPAAVHTFCFFWVFCSLLDTCEHRNNPWY